MVASGTMVGVGLAPYFMPGGGKLVIANPGAFFGLSTMIILLTGLYNASAAKPSQLEGGAAYYRVLIYGVKIFLLLCLTPLLDKLVPEENLQNHIRAAVVILQVITGSHARYYREETLRAVQANTKRA